MKILYIVDTLGMGGGKERQLTTLLKEIKKHNDIIPLVIVLYNHPLYEDFKNLSIDYVILNKTKFFDFKLIINILKTVNEFQPDIIHSWEWYSTLAVLPAKLINGACLINGSIRNAIPCKTLSKSWIYSKLLFLFSSRIIANSRAGLEAYGKKEDKKYRVIHNGFDISRIEKKEINIDVSENIKSKYVIGMIARFYAQKDHKTVIQAISKLIEDGYDLSLIMVGEGDTLETIKHIVKSKGINKDRFIFVGARSDVEVIISLCDICVLSTNVKIHREGIPNSIMEYMAMKKPVVATRNGGTEELVFDNETGFLVEPFNVQDMGNKIKILIENASLRKKFGMNGYEKIINEFSVSKMYNSYIRLYKEVLK
jgi:glycosyltransferase involved in cell wall biosynthesis